MFKKRRQKVKPRENTQCIHCTRNEERLCNIEKMIQMIIENSSKMEIDRVKHESMVEDERIETSTETRRIFEDIRHCLVNIMNKEKKRNFFSINF